MPERTFVGFCLSWETVGPALEVRLHRDPCNEIGTAMLGELELLVDELARDRSHRAVILYSDRPRGFCAGADLRELHAGLMERRQGPLGRILGRVPMGKRIGKRLLRREIRRFIDRIHRVMDALDQHPALTIAVCRGVVFGGGFELALTADVRIGEPNARFSFPELRLGLVPGFGGIPRLERDVGNAQVRDVLLSGRSLGAKRASEVGLLAQLVGRDKGLDVARKLALQAAKFDPVVTAKAKRFAKPDLRARLDEEKRLFCEMVTEPAVWEALTAFTEDASPTPYLPRG